MSECLNCAHSLPEAAKHCPACGQKVESRKLPLKELVPVLYDNLIGVSSKAIIGLYLLQFKPGVYSSSYNAGKRLSYMHPLQLFLFTLGICFFLLKRLAAGSGEKVTKMDFFFDNFIYFALFFLIPICVLVLKALNPRYWLSEHFIFALELGSRMVLMAIFASLFALFPSNTTTASGLIQFAFLVYIFFMLLYNLHLFYSLYKGLKLMYENSRIRAFLGAVVLFVTLMGLLFFALVFAFIDPTRPSTVPQ